MTPDCPLTAGTSRQTRGGSWKRHTDYISNLLSLSSWHHICHCGFPDYCRLWTHESVFPDELVWIFPWHRFSFLPSCRRHFLDLCRCFWCLPKLPNARELFLDCWLFWPSSLLITQNDIEPHETVWPRSSWRDAAQRFPLDVLRCALDWGKVKSSQLLF